MNKLVVGDIVYVPATVIQADDNLVTVEIYTQDMDMNFYDVYPNDGTLEFVDHNYEYDGLEEWDILEEVV